MKFNFEVLKKWSNNSNINYLVDYFIFSGFESFIDDDNVNIDLPYNKRNFSNLFSILGKCLNFSYINNFNLKPDFKNDFQVFLKDGDFCSIFCGLFIKDIDYKSKTPLFIKQSLLNNNLSFTNNIIIDIINYVTLITGQPLHGYDLDSLKFPIFIDKTQKEEKISTINSVLLNLDFNTPIIRDSEKIISFPGIIGCSNSMIKSDTKSIFLESAFFNNETISSLSKKYNLNTNSSFLFSNIINPNFSNFSLIYSAFLFKIFTGSVSSSILEINTSKKKFNDSVFVVAKNEISKVLGLNIKNSSFYKCSKKLDFPFKISENCLKFNIPFYRTDIFTKENLISDFLRVYGYKNIPCIPVNSFSIPNFIDNRFNYILDFLSNIGFFEVINYTFVEGKIESLLHPEVNFINIKNPMSGRMNVMRCSLLHGLLKSVKNNIKRGNDNLCFFETGNTFFYKNSFIEKKSIAGICSEQFIVRNYGFDKSNCFFIIKSIVENICFLYFKNNNFTFSYSFFNYSDTDLSLSVFVNDLIIGNFCLLSNNILNSFDIKQNLYFFQIYLENLSDKNNKFYKKISKYQKVKRDLSIILNNDILYISLVNFINNFKILILKDFFILDVYFLESNKKSFTIRFFLQSSFKTLSESEIRFVFIFLREKIKKHFNALVKN